MLWAASRALWAVYLAMPVLWPVLAWNGRPWVRRFTASGWVGGMVLGAVIIIAYAVATDGRPSGPQAVLTLYLGVGLLLWLKTMDLGLQAILRRALLGPRAGRWRGAAVSLVRVVLFGGVALPWVMAAVMVYRPKVQTRTNPGDVLNATYEDVTFPATDGTPIAGWFVPAEHGSHTTALLCPGLGSSRAGFFPILQKLHAAGVNVLAIDLRAHGGSGGQLCSFGVRERDDVHGAIDWLKASEPRAAGRVVGVGASLGAAALLAEAAEDERVDGVVVLATYATMADEVDDVSRRQLVPPIGWLVRQIGLPLASLHAGTDLRVERPVDAVARLWPRPVLIVQGTDDEIIPFADGRALYAAAPVGRQSMWVAGGTHNGILEDPAVLARVVGFVRSARPTPLV